MYANVKAMKFNTQGNYGLNVEAIIIRVANIMLLSGRDNNCQLIIILIIIIVYR